METTEKPPLFCHCDPADCGSGNLLPSVIARVVPQLVPPLAGWQSINNEIASLTLAMTKRKYLQAFKKLSLRGLTLSTRDNLLTTGLLRHPATCGVAATSKKEGVRHNHFRFALFCKNKTLS